MRPGPWLVVPAALVLGGCAAVPPADDELTFEARRDRLERVESWEMSGRLAVEAGEEGHLARFRWVQDEDALRLNVRAGPFGASSFEIRGTPPLLTVTARGETYRLDDAEAQLSEWFGWWLPVTSLSSWLLGLPDPEFGAATTFRGDVLESIQQRLWEVDYGEYMLAEGLLVPHEIGFRHSDVSIELTVDEWLPGPAEN